MKDINELLYGKEAAKKIKNFKIGMAQIEEKYSEYFTNRKSKYDSDDYDRLHNHYGTITNSSGISFNFYPESDLDESIKSECRDLFNLIFK